MNSLIKIILISLIALSLVSCANVQAENLHKENKADKINEIISLYADYEGFNGSVLVSHEGKIIFKKGFGLANMEWDIPNDVDTKFKLASLTKPFTALLIMQLVAEGKLNLHTPIAQYLPNYPKKNADQITIHHLLTHSSGTPNSYESDDRLSPFPDKAQPQQLVQQFSNIDLEFKPGKRFSYSNSGYVVLGYLLETVTGKKYGEILEEKITKPLGMTNTGYSKHRPITKKRSSGYFKSYGEYYNANYIDMSSVFSAGAMYSTVEDLNLWDQALYSEKLLPKKYMDLIFTKHMEDPEYKGHYGYGWELINKPIGNSNTKTPTMSHGGGIDGYSTIFTRIPSSKSSIILLNNTRRAFLNAITKAVTGILNDTSYDFPKKPIAMFMADVIKKEGIEKGILFYKKHKGLSDYHVDETELIVEGYKLLHTGNASDAAAIFKLSTEVFPDRDNPYDSYAEALMALGNNEEAIKNYRKSLALNPNNNNAKEMLKKLK